jgi:signal transduction histidine kinase/CheY-like chemotaxis protein
MKQLDGADDFPALARASRFLAGMVLLWCPFALAGWLWQMPALTTLFAGPAQMSAPTIMGFIPASAAILLLTLNVSQTPVGQAAHYALLAIAAAISLYALTDYLGLIAASADLPTTERGYVFGQGLGRVALGTAVNFLLLVLSLATGRTPLGAQASAAFAGLGLIISILALIGFAYDAQSLDNVLPFSAMSLPTAIAFTLTFCAALLARPTLGWMTRIISPDSGGVAARRLLPAVIAVPILISGIVSASVDSKMFASSFGFAVVAIATTITLAIITYLVSAWLARRDIELIKEVTLRRSAQARLQTQNDRLNLLNQITQAITERHDLGSIFQVVLRTLEDRLPVEFSMICLYDSTTNELTVHNVGSKSTLLASAMALNEHSRIEIDENGLSRCVKGNLIYEPDMKETIFPFPRRLADQNLNAMVLTPLLIDGDVFAILVCAKTASHSFSSSDCEFLKQLGEHVTIAARQSQLHQNLQAAYDDLRQTQQAALQQERLRAVGQMASGIAHDINNAISPISLRTQVMLESRSDLPDRVVDYLDAVNRQINDVAATVVRLREFYREREETTTLAPVNLNALVEDVIELTSARWKDMARREGATITVETRLAPNNPVVMGKDNELREALVNLVFNAVDAMPDGGTLTLSTRQASLHSASGDDEQRSVLLEVIDTGIGMNAATIRRCMEPFFTTKGEQGTGLGLAMVYGILKRNEADIEITSAPGEGTTVSLSFPLPGDITARDTGQSRNLKPEPMRLLLIDDDPFVLDTLSSVLELDGHDIVSSTDSREGVDLFRASLDSGQPFDTVITDLGMPYMDGNQVTHAIKSLMKEMPVILLTGWGQRLGDNKQKSEAKADFVIGKPPQLSKLRETLMEVQTGKVDA